MLSVIPALLPAKCLVRGGDREHNSFPLVFRASIPLATTAGNSDDDWEPAALPSPGATYPRTFIEGTLGLPGIIQEVITVELQQDPPPPKVKGQLGSAASPCSRTKNQFRVTWDKKTKTTWGEGIPNIKSLSLASRVLLTSCLP